MNRYTIFCTPEQTRKALELGAPISEAMSRYNSRLAYDRIVQGKETKEYYNSNGIAFCYRRTYNIPTAEQMIGYLEEEYNLQFFTGLDIDDLFFFNIYDKDGLILEPKSKPSRQEATLAAIDAALKYLTNTKK